jgi:hypothetical protein
VKLEGRIVDIPLAPRRAIEVHTVRELLDAIDLNLELAAGHLGRARRAAAAGDDRVKHQAVSDADRCFYVIDRCVAELRRRDTWAGRATAPLEIGRTNPN